MAHKRTRKEFEADLQAQQSPFVTYGTPLPALDPDVRDDGSYVPVWKQEVVDERGQKRLHGAFTGGFSAGYFNTVGSKEGWAPSTFVSSRSNRHKDDKQKAAQRLEDFMDEEDLAAASEAQTLETNQGFSGIGSTRDDPQLKGGMLDLFKSNQDSIGVKLLRKMGWRDGQGVGPKVRRKAALNEGASAEEELQEEQLFAPKDSTMIQFHRKDDSKGVGYGGEARLEDPSDVNSDTRVSNNNGMEGSSTRPRHLVAPAPEKRRGGFGVGVLNDQGSDDEDEFAVGPRIAYNRTIGGDKRVKTKMARAMSSKAANPLLKAKPVYQPKKHFNTKTGFRRCHDGKLPLEGFVLAETSTISIEAEHRPLEVPEGWKSAKVPSAEATTITSQSPADVAKASKLDAKARAAILGETQLPGKSVFDFMSTSARDRIASASGKTDLPSALAEKMPKDSRHTKLETSVSEQPSVDASIALAALGRGTGGWMPYAEDKDKRLRYVAFIEHHAGVRSEPPQRTPKVAHEHWLQELREFAHAAEVFKPVSGIMASRFASASSAPIGGTADPNEGELHTPVVAEKRSDPAEEAARMGLFGPMTRSTTQFFPTRLLCKRFNVRLPAHAESTDGADVADTHTASASSAPRPQQQTADLLSQGTMDQMRMHAQQTRPGQQKQIENVPGSTPEAVSNSAMRDGPAKVDASRNDALEARRAGEAVFKAVFGDDSDSS